MGKGCVFISYRRDDSAGYARAIYNQLVQYFSEERIFMDVDTIEPGLEFDEAIKLAIGSCDVFIAIIGKHWLGNQGENNLRINDPNDYVRLEISTALSRNIRLIPVLLDGTSMPNEEVLPESLRPLTRRHAFEINSSRFNFDLNRLITNVSKALGENGKLNEPLDKRYYWLVGGFSFGSLVGVLFSASYFQKGEIIDSFFTILSFAGLGLWFSMLGYRKFALFSTVVAYAANFYRDRSDNDLSTNNLEGHESDKGVNSDDNLYIVAFLSDNDVSFDFDSNDSLNDDIHELNDS